MGMFHAVMSYLRMRNSPQRDSGERRGNNKEWSSNTNKWEEEKETIVFETPTGPIKAVSGFDDYGVHREGIEERYPPYNRGCAVRTVDEIVDSQAALIGQILRHLGNNPHGQLLVRSAIRRLVETVMTMPATSNGIFRGQGGLFRYALEIGYFAMRGIGGLTLTSMDAPAERSELEKKWTVAAFMAGICIEVDKVVSGAMVTNKNGEAWDPYMKTLAKWLEENEVDVYYVNWYKKTELQKAGEQLRVIGYGTQLINDEIRAYLYKGSRQILQTLLSTVTSNNTLSDNAFTKLIARVQLKVAESDLNRIKSEGVPIVGSHLQPYLLDAMRVLVREGKWGVNVKGGRVWISQSGAFVAWGPGAAKDIGEVLSDFNGIPRDHITIGEILQACGAFLHTEDNKWLWEIMPRGVPSSFNAVALRSPSLLFSEFNDKELVEIKVISANKQEMKSAGPVATLNKNEEIKETTASKANEASGSKNGNGQNDVGTSEKQNEIESKKDAEVQPNVKNMPDLAKQGKGMAEEMIGKNEDANKVVSLAGGHDPTNGETVEGGEQEVIEAGTSRNGRKKREQDRQRKPVEVYTDKQGPDGAEERVVNIDRILGRIFSEYIKSLAARYAKGELKGIEIDGGMKVNINDIGSELMPSVAVASKLHQAGLLVPVEEKIHLIGEEGQEQIVLSPQLVKAAGFIGRK